ncbi:copper resistance protein CopC [Jannaschia sp. S6380]|uniref:copper resistance CopC family protein n=1 Tax=Jannaschia sp. S6380 TaxID=2926408 RepID=UPI001FF59778|nr:copper resistance CopC family protein [Jannaschia sp. S6380]MCK0167648.1 copper resistance protein CopC [Jannaschia sp. S6380]
MTKHVLPAMVAMLAMATSALAHSQVEDMRPADGGILQTVEAIELRFDAPMRITAITLTGPDGDMAVTRETGLDPVTAFRALPPDAMPAGAYRVDWRGLAADGHPMQGTFGFTLTD